MAKIKTQKQDWGQFELTPMNTYFYDKWWSWPESEKWLLHELIPINLIFTANGGAGRNCTGVQRNFRKWHYMLSLCLNLSPKTPKDRDFETQLPKSFIPNPESKA